MLVIEKFHDKLLAISQATDAMHSINSVHPGTYSDETFKLLNEIKMDLIDAKDQEEFAYDNC